MLGLRRREGVSIDVFHHAEGVVVPEWQTIMQELITHDYVTEINGYYRLTDRGMDIYNTIITQLL